MKQTVTDILLQALNRAREAGELKLDPQPQVTLETPRDKGHGDLATTLALTLAKSEGKQPRKIAEIILRHIQDTGNVLAKTEIAGPGFINFSLRQDRWRETLFDIDKEGDTFGLANLGEGRSILLEFVSANPTGPLHVGHGRGAAVGDALGNLLAAVGFSVTREFYINDAGKQIRLLALSIYTRYQQAQGNDLPFPEDGYHGSYIEEIARDFTTIHGGNYKGVPFDTCIDVFGEYGKKAMLADIRKDLEAFGVRFDEWFSEKSLLTDGSVASSIEELRESRNMYEKDGALWLRSTTFGDDKDRVVKKQDGDYTYLATDIAYHRNKIGRGYQTLVNIWGADHHGYIPRVQAVIEAFGHPKDSLRVLLVQLVTLLRHGQPVPMSKRAGDFVTLRDVVQEVGADAARYIFLTRKTDSHLDFDLDIAKEQSRENPVYYVQYAHARIASIFREAESRGIAFPTKDSVKIELLDLEEEQNIIKALAKYPEMIEEAALAYEPHRITFYLQDLAGIMHNYYFKHRIIDAEDPARTGARLFLMKQVKTVIGSALGILGVAAPDRM